MNLYYNAQTKLLSSRLDVDPSIDYSLDEIKHRLLDSMYPALIKHLDVAQGQVWVGSTQIWRATLNVAPVSTRQVMLNGDYSFGNNLFNLDQINHALTQTYPELFL